MLLIPFWPLTTAKVLALKATILVLLTLLIKAKVRITALSGLVLQLLKSWCGDADGQGFGLGFQLAGALSLQAEHDLTQGGISLLAAPSLACCGKSAGAAGYRQAALRAPALAGSGEPNPPSSQP